MDKMELVKGQLEQKQNRLDEMKNKLVFRSNEMQENIKMGRFETVANDAQMIQNMANEIAIMEREMKEYAMMIEFLGQ
ncbi:hypothetical protein OCO53_25470 [Peribacillus frigoritolerans]|uniref:hypothetical protein n=1 Tax=Peribacillus frigoritolerans TaxID=450367 RepID=UPI0021D3395A|nr:hypothetical protein [Peribacillus frigoritolerans]MCU6603793.1 hypothetical protein [Peribacillus frigoritolerans]